MFFLFSPVFIFGGWKLRSKLGLKNHFCGKNGTFENLVSQLYFASKDTKFVHWHYSPISNSSRDIPQKWFFNPNFEHSFHPPNMKTGKNKKTRVSYFSVLYNISKNQNNRTRTPKILSLWVVATERRTQKQLTKHSVANFCRSIIWLKKTRKSLLSVHSILVAWNDVEHIATHYFNSDAEKTDFKNRF